MGEIMNTFYVSICQSLENKRKIDAKGYFVLTTDDNAVYSNVVPPNTRVVTMQDFEDSLVDGMRHVIQKFSASGENKEVFAFILSVNDHYRIRSYINTLPAFNKSIEDYYSQYTEKEQHQIKYNLGDFPYEFYDEDMGPSGEMVTAFESIAFVFGYEPESLEEISDSDEPKIAFEKAIFLEGYYVLALNAVKRLIAENAFASLDRTDDFVSFADTNYRWTDKSVTMRKTIPIDLLYKMYPDLKDMDAQFNEILEKQSHMSISDKLDHWVEVLESKFNDGNPYHYDKTAYHVFLSWEVHGNELAEECIKRVEGILSHGTMDLPTIEKLSVLLKALEFAGTISDDALKRCDTIITRLRAEEDFDPFTLHDLVTFIKSQ